jgi:hypothetical protein
MFPPTQGVEAMATYKGQKVTTREITRDDKGFDAAVPKVIVIKSDGTEEAVPKADVSNQ